MTQVSIGQAMHDAVAHHVAGRNRDAESICRRVLAMQPNQPDALDLLAVIAAQSGRRDLAIVFIRRAIAAAPGNPCYHYHLGIHQQTLEHLDEAIACYQRALALKPDYPEAHYNLGRAWNDKGDLDQAIAWYQRALALRPAMVEAQVSLGFALQIKGQTNEAMALFQRALALRPDYAEAHCNLGNAYGELKDPDSAIACYERALALKPDMAVAHYDLANVWREKGRLDEAIAGYERAIALDPQNRDFCLNLGVAWYDAGDLEMAIACFRRTLELDSKFVKAIVCLGVALSKKGLMDDAIACQRQAIAVAPDFADAHYNLALALLATGDLAEGWNQYEWRWLTSDFERRRVLPKPEWTPSDAAGRSILLTTEQGFGDTIQFVRYAPLVASRWQSVILECPPELCPLLHGMPGIDRLIPKGHPLPDFDAHCPLLSLPAISKTTLNSIPAEVPYVKADPARVAAWSARLVGDQRLKIGLAWAGSSIHKNDRNRSTMLATFAPLAGIPGIAFHSLQKGPPAQQAQSPPTGMSLIDHTAHLLNFADTAALIANLDLVISVDTAVVHVAGAMARPVWTLLPFSPDWRWLLSRSDSPWYPTMRLFRQPAIGDWAALMRQVADALSQWVQVNRRRC